MGAGLRGRNVLYIGRGSAYRRLERPERATAREIAHSAVPSGDRRLDAGAYAWSREAALASCSVSAVFAVFGCVSIFARHFVNGAGSFLAAIVALSIGAYRVHRFLVLKKELQVTCQHQQRD
jgi:hypothetical protein